MQQINKNISKNEKKGGAVVAVMLSVHHMFQSRAALAQLLVVMNFVDRFQFDNRLLI
jgi:hypothetical protein